VDLTVILGPPGSGKAGRAIDALRGAAGRGDDAFLCVPGAVDRARFLRELAGGDVGVLVGVEVGTFDQLVARVAGSPPVRRTDRAMERIVVRDALRDVPAFEAASSWTGFVDTARRHVDELRRARVWGGDEIDRVEGQLPGLPVVQWRRLEQRVGELLDERRLRDDAWFERGAARRLRGGEPGVDAVVVYGFESFTPGRLELLERLAVRVPVTVALAWRPGRRVHERAADLRDRWRDAGAFIDELDADPVAHPVLEWLGSELFEDAAPASAPASNPDPSEPTPVAFVDCCGPTQEAEEVVREVALLHGRGLAWDDIVVARADASSDGELLLAMFQRAGIPARLQARRSAVDVAVGRGLHELIGAIVDRDPIRVIGAVRAGAFGVDRSRIDAAEVRLRRARHVPADGFRSAALQRVLSSPIATLSQLPIDDPGIVAAVRDVIASMQPRDLGELDLLRGIAALVDGLVVAADSEEAVGLVDIRDAIAAFPLTTPDRSDAGTVVLASLDDLRSVAYDAVVLQGMHLAGFRARVDDEHDAPAAGRDLLHLAVTRARRTLRIVRQATGASGNHQAPSPGWQELRRLLPDAPLRTRRLGEVLVDPSDVRLEHERAASAALADGRGITVDGIDDELQRQIDQQRRGARTARVTGLIAEPIAQRSTIAVTEIEQYATCSAKWFIERRMRDSDPDDDRSRITDGLLAHALLQRLVPDARGQSISIDELRTRSMQLMPELLVDIDMGSTLPASRIERIVEHVLALIDAEQAWQVPDHIDVERSFGRDTPDAIGPGLVVGDVELVGRIDRIDHHGSGVVLHDYKHGSSPRPMNRLIADRNLQLLVYWLALRQPGTPHEPIGALYRAVTNAGAPSGVLTDELKAFGVVGARTRTLDHDGREALLDEAFELVRGVVHDMQAGVVGPLDDPARCPSHCRLQLVCRVGEEDTT
jgi:hypothetical protein